MGPSPGPIPIQLVKHLARDHECWAIGNQNLVAEAEIKPIDEMWRLLAKEPAFPPTGESADVIIADPEKLRYHLNAKRNRLFHLGSLYPKIKTRIVVDDLEYGCKGWTHYFPEQFLELARAMGWRRSLV